MTILCATLTQPLYVHSRSSEEQCWMGLRKLHALRRCTCMEGWRLLCLDRYTFSIISCSSCLLCLQLGEPEAGWSSLRSVPNVDHAL